MGGYILGIDAGSTVTKAVLFDERGREIAQASRRVAHDLPRPHHVERDQNTLWEATCSVIREVIEVSQVAASDIAGVGATSHGDGIYLVDADGRPTRPGILSLDTRAASIASGWDAAGLGETILPLSGQKPWPGSPASVLAWLAEHEPEVIERTAWALPGKDMIKQRLTGEFSTDPTEASLSFTNVETQVYDDSTLALFGIPELRRLLPPVVASGSTAGTVSAAAAAECGLIEGTPVSSGAHDVDCGAIGLGSISPGQLAIIAGTFSINEVISDHVAVDPRWNARNFVVPGQWMNMSLSPSSATNLEWFTQKLAALDIEAGRRDGHALAFVERDIAAIQEQPSDLVYLPFLYGSPYPVDAGAAFVGLRGWHERGHLLRAVMEGVVFNHRFHVDALADGFSITDARLTGGATQSTRWTQLFADALDRPITVGRVQEAGALGTAMLAGMAVGLYSDLADASAATDQGGTVYEPDPAGVQRSADAYGRYQRVVEALHPIWADA